MRVEGEMVKVGCMNKPKRILLVASVLLVCVSSADAGRWSFWSDAGAAEPVTAAAAPLTLSAIEVDGARIVLRTTGAPAYTSYSPSPGVFVVDLTGTARASELTVPSPLPGAIRSLAAEDVVEMGNRLTRLTFRLAQPMQLEVVSADNALIVRTPSIVTADANPLVEAVDPVALPAVETSRAEPVAEPPVRVVEPTVVAEEVSLPKAKNVRRIETKNGGEGIEVIIAGDGRLAYKTFTLQNPSRLVIDIEGRNTVSRANLTVDDPAVKGVRVAQFSPAVARVVVDLARETQYDVTPDGDRLLVSFGGRQAAPATRVAAATPAPPKPSAPAKSIEDIPSIAAANVPAWVMPEASKGARQVINAPAPQSAPATTTTTTTTTTRDDVFADAADQAPTPPPGQTITGTRQLSGGPRQYNGEPLSLNLKDADIRDVFATFAELTGLNIAVDPGVAGSVTVDFIDVPWDQALDIILRQNGLTFIIDGNVMRIGTVDRIAAETAATRRLADEERLNVPLTAISYKLSYARAAEVATLLRQIASPRAQIIVDSRTNQLIISEIPAYLQTMQNLLTTLDIPNKQVVIEARIVESSRTFAQQYGFSYGFEGVLDPAFGNGTGLVFPNRVGFTGGPFSFTGGAAPVLGVSLTDVLGTFSLDFALHAAESQGYIRVISAPRVTTSDNTPAEIQSGFQIPYQTRVNFTTTVQYLDATLRLSVTPQITEAGTVIMEISVQKNEPATGLTIEGAAGTPLTTRQARTRLMVRDGGTAVIAGIFQTRDNNAQSRLPFIHQIPILGNLFKSHNVQTSHDELLIFITPRIVRG